MTGYVTDGFLFVGLLAGAWYAYHAIPDNLNYIRNLSACPEQIGPGPRKQLQKDAENAISIDTLRVLSEGPSYDLRASTIKIVASRTLKSRAKKLLLQDLESTDEDRRYKAICAIWMLLYNPSLQGRHLMDQFLNFDFFYSLITALRNVLADHQTAQHKQNSNSETSQQPEPKIPPSPIKPPVRPYHEMSLMMILRALLETPMPRGAPSVYSNSTMCALAAGLVDRWLKDYPFPCALPENSKYNFKKSDVVSLLEARAWGKDDDLMTIIVSHINMTGMGKKLLRDAGLRGSSYTEIEDLENTVSRWRHFPTRLDLSETDQDVHMINGESTAGAAAPLPIPLDWDDMNEDTPQARSHELSQEEESLRRRRREAVVVAEPGVPLSQENILQRTDSGSAWRSEPDVDVVDSNNNNNLSPVVGPSSNGIALLSANEPELPPSSPPTELRPPPPTTSFEDRFEQHIRHLTDLQAELQTLRDEALDRLDLHTTSIMDSFSALIYRIKKYTAQVERAIISWDLSNEQRAEFRRRLKAVTADAGRVWRSPSSSSSSSTSSTQPRKLGGGEGEEDDGEDDDGGGESASGFAGAEEEDSSHEEGPSSSE